MARKNTDPSEETAGTSEAETMGERLARLRKAAGLSQSELARAIKAPVRSLQNWEQDKREMRIDAVVKVARALGITTDTLLGVQA